MAIPFTRPLTRPLEDAALFAARFPRLNALSRYGFTALAGLATNLRPLPVAAAGCCTAPAGTDTPCPSIYCSGPYCTGDCQFTYGFCPSGGACWCTYLCGNHTLCCDCYCSGGSGGPGYTCYCNGGDSAC